MMPNCTSEALLPATFASALGSLWPMQPLARWAHAGMPRRAKKEWEAAADVLQLHARHNLGLPDGHLPRDDHRARATIVELLRATRPEQILCMHATTRHPDHQALAHLVSGAVKAAALHRLPVATDDPPLASVRLWYYEAELPITPTLLVPCTEDDWAVKNAAIDCYATQITPTAAGEPETSIGHSSFRHWVNARGQAWGWHANAPYAEALSSAEIPYCEDLRHLR